MEEQGELKNYFTNNFVNSFVEKNNNYVLYFSFGLEYFLSDFVQLRVFM